MKGLCWVTAMYCKRGGQCQALLPAHSIDQQVQYNIVSVMKGILDTLGAEVTGTLPVLLLLYLLNSRTPHLNTRLSCIAGIVAPVSICMALTVLLVRLLNPSGDSETTAVFIASAYYSEKVGKVEIAAE